MPAGNASTAYNPIKLFTRGLLVLIPFCIVFVIANRYVPIITHSLTPFLCVYPLIIAVIGGFTRVSREHARNAEKLDVTLALLIKIVGEAVQREKEEERKEEKAKEREEEAIQ